MKEKFVSFSMNTLFYEKPAFFQCGSFWDSFRFGVRGSSFCQGAFKFDKMKWTKYLVLVSSSASSRAGILMKFFKVGNRRRGQNRRGQVGDDYLHLIKCQ